MALKTVLTSNVQKLLQNRRFVCISTLNSSISSTHSKQVNEIPFSKVAKTESFATMFRNSAYVQLGIGGVEGTLLKGKVVQIVDNSLFVDYGGKFYCVCKVDDDVIKKAFIGKAVCVKLLDPELSARFLGSYTDTTLLESKALYYSLWNHKTEK